MEALGSLIPMDRPADPTECAATPRTGSLVSVARRRLARLRRVLAALVLGAISIGCLEPLIAEAHDGDSTGRPTTALESVVDVQVPTEPTRPTHQMHLCHCTHAHGASTLPSTEVVVVVSLVEETTPQRPLMAPSSVSLERLLRPPAAAHG